MELPVGGKNLALKYGEAKKQLDQSDRTGEQASIDSDVDVIRLRYEGTKILPAGVNRNFLNLKFAGIFMGDPDKVSEALVTAVAAQSSRDGTRSRRNSRGIMEATTCPRW
jgi:uncharacterized protein YfaA (DUF2138 family)